MAIGETEIVNMALDLLEEEPILSADDNRSVARWAQRNLGPVCDAMLRQHPWNWAIRRAVLPALADKPAFGWARAFQMPIDCLRVLPIYDPARFNGADALYEIEGRRILTDLSAPLSIRYIARVSSADYDPMFVQALAASLAFRMASFVTGKQSYAERMREYAREALLQAQMVDALEGAPETPAGDFLINARQTGVM